MAVISVRMTSSDCRMISVGEKRETEITEIGEVFFQKGIDRGKPIILDINSVNCLVMERSIYEHSSFMAGDGYWAGSICNIIVRHSNIN